jgi:hypothetical protein
MVVAQELTEAFTVETQRHHWSIRPYRRGDEDRILQLFHRVFGKERSLKHWQWKFRDNPEGAYIHVVETDTGEIVGHYAGIPVRVAAEGKSFVFLQLVDTMVDRDYRCGLKKPGMFAQLFMKFAEDYGGHDRAAIMYGFPIPEALRIGQRLLGYVPLHPVMKLVRPIKGTPDSAPRPRMVDLLQHVRIRVRQVTRFDVSADRLWEECRRELRVATVRDARYLNWRYVDCPDAKYTLLVAENMMRFSLQGIAVLRLDSLGQGVGFLMDWLIPFRAKAAADQLLARSIEEAESAGVKELQVWLPASSPWYRCLLDRGFQVADTQYVLVARTFTSNLPLEFVNPRWYYTMGDSDIY